MKKILLRNIEVINNKVNNYEEGDIIICVTGVVNFSAFVCYFYDIEPTNDVL